MWPFVSGSVVSDGPVTPLTAPAFRDALAIVTAVNSAEPDYELMGNLAYDVPPERRVMVIAILAGWLSMACSEDHEGMAQWTANVGLMIAEAES